MATEGASRRGPSQRSPQPAPERAPQDTERRLRGRYRLIRPLGRGGMGTVWLAEDGLLHRRVAVKELRVHPATPADDLDEVRARLLREARAAASLDHRNVVTVHDVVEEDGRPWIVMEHIRGRSLQEVLDHDGPLPPGHAARIGAQILAGLRRAHEAGVLHRDVKPANVLIDESGRAVLTDFGIASVRGDAALTAPGTLLGSLAYMAPERVPGSPVAAGDGPECDLWGLGATLYACVEGTAPFPDDDPVAALQGLVSGPLPRPEHGGALTTLITRLMCRDPAERIDAEGTRLALEAVMDAEAHAGPDTEASTSTARPPRPVATPWPGERRRARRPLRAPWRRQRPSPAPPRGGRWAAPAGVAVLGALLLVAAGLTVTRFGLPGQATTAPASPSPSPTPTPTASKPPVAVTWEGVGTEQSCDPWFYAGTPEEFERELAAVGMENGWYDDDALTETGATRVHNIYSVVVEGPPGRSVVLTGARVTVVERAPAPDGIWVTRGGCGGAVVPRVFDVDLDAPRPAAVAADQDFPLTVDATDPEVLELYARTTDCECSWTVELDWVADGVRGTSAVGTPEDPLRALPDSFEDSYYITPDGLLPFSGV
ncbi:serine/threonine-protein kinase [Allostreptomyces psammosilenae]|uniref:non-specific serine/threonine protein kinase n=1 Tax=Allostreptomyces psammosilenae TaxID=1892865 RepID=A0A852ZQD1_9ACTN|nr:serine/threonine-protein kinase [Allostreptomyces psammosilenae]NYI03480.1 serine/threonine protein kinase [Allostreptomyces psammosilenae]